MRGPEKGIITDLPQEAQDSAAAAEAANLRAELEELRAFQETMKLRVWGVTIWGQCSGVYV